MCYVQIDGSKYLCWLLNYSIVSSILIHVLKHSFALRKWDRKSLIYVREDTVGTRLSGSFSFYKAGSFSLQIQPMKDLWTWWELPWGPLGHLPEHLRYSLSLAGRVYNTL
jgi:hypothetical protein